MAYASIKEPSCGCHTSNFITFFAFPTPSRHGLCLSVLARSSRLPHFCCPVVAAFSFSVNPFFSPSHPGMAYASIKEPSEAGGAATVSPIQIKKVGEAVLTNGGTPAATAILTWSEYSNTELVIPDIATADEYAVYTAVPYAGPARGTGANGLTWIGFVPKNDLVS